MHPSEFDALRADQSNVIDLDTGDEYEWVGPTGYAHVLDHDFAWPREDLLRSGNLVDVDRLDPDELAGVRAKYNADDAPSRDQMHAAGVPVGGARTLRKWSCDNAQ